MRAKLLSGALVLTAAVGLTAIIFIDADSDPPPSSFEHFESQKPLPESDSDRSRENVASAKRHAAPQPDADRVAGGTGVPKDGKVREPTAKIRKAFGAGEGDLAGIADVLVPPSHSGVESGETFPLNADGLAKSAMAEVLPRKPQKTAGELRERVGDIDRAKMEAGREIDVAMGSRSGDPEGTRKNVAVLSGRGEVGYGIASVVARNRLKIGLAAPPPPARLTPPGHAPRP